MNSTLVCDGVALSKSFLCTVFPPLRGASELFLLDIDTAEPDELLKALAAGERWITVHPPGHDVGVPILITEHPDGTATVIGGAGGSMNHLKLRGIKPQSEYRQALADKSKERREAKQAGVAASKADGTYEAKQGQRKQLKAEMVAQRKDFIATVAEAAGWSEKETQFDEAAHAELPPEVQDKARKDHEKELFTRAKKTVDLNRQRLVEDHDARTAAGLGEVPLASESADVLSAADLDPMPEKTPGLGFAPEYKARAEAQGLTATALKDAADALSAPVDPQKAADKKATAEGIQQELDLFKAANPEVKPPDPKVLEDAQKAATMVRALKKLRLMEKAAREASGDIDAGALPESKAAILEVSDAQVEAAAAKEIEDDVRTVGTRSFLQEAEKLGGESGLGGHVGLGAFNALNAFSMTVGGQSMIDRSVVDVLGVDGASAILARQVAQALPADELQQTRDAMGDYHKAHYEKTQGEVMDRAQAYHDAAAAIEIPEASNGFELAEAVALNAKRRDAIGEAKKIVGQAMGEMRANASLVSALNAPPVKSLDVSLGKQSAESAIVQLHAIGLENGDYVLAPAGDNLVVTVNAAGLDRLAKPIDSEGMAIIKRNVDIANGKMDEDDWLPDGFARRPDLAMHAEPGVAPRLAKPFQPGADLAQSIRSYIGGRVADGDVLSDVLADLQSADFYQKAGNNEAYRKALDEVAPLKGEDGKMRPIESLQERFEGYADAFVADNYGPGTSTLHRQTFAVDQHSVDALHRALSECPEGVGAFKAIGDLTSVDRMGLRSWWHKNIAKEDPQAVAMREGLEAHVANEPEKSFEDMFGEVSTNPEWSDWNAKKNDLSGQLNASSLDWSKYVDTMGSPTKAIEAVQDLVRSHVTHAFADTHNRLNPGNPLKIGKTTIRGALDHLDAVDPAARASRQAKQKELIDALRERINGKYASGSVSDKLEAAKEEKAAFEQAQMGFFSTEEQGGLFGDDDPASPASSKPIALGSDERYTVGHAAEQKMAGMMAHVGENFHPGKPSKIWQPSMNGKFVAQQRAIKHIVANKRTVFGYGAGSGKTGIMLGAYTHLQSQGAVKRALYMVPSIVQGQFGGEALRFLEPGKYKWHAEPGASREERIAAYKDQSNHFCVMTHQSFRDDMVHMGSQHAGISEGEMTQKLAGMSPQDRAGWAKATMEKEGINFDASFVDEAHETVNRAGKENSSLANVLDSVTDNTPYYAYASGDPIKNDASELQDVMAKMDRARYGDRPEFMRKYGADAVSSKQALKREMARHIISNTISSGAASTSQVINVEMSAGQQAAMKDLDKAMSRSRLARMAGKIDVESAKAISPGMFEGVPEDQHEKVAGVVQKSLGIIKTSAQQRIINAHESSSKYDEIVKQAKARTGKQGVVFANRRESVAAITQRLTAEGFNVVTITGSDSAKDKDAKRLAFNPESGKGTADILVASDAAAVGMNLQSGQYLIQHDTPQTAKTHGQRRARIDRIGQKQNIDLIDLKANHPSEDRARDRLAKKYQLREFMLDPMDGLDDSGLAHFLHQRSLNHQINQGALF